VWRSRRASDDLWRETKRAPPDGFCGGGAERRAAARATVVCAHAGVDGVRRRNSRAALKQAAELFDCVEFDVSAALTGELLALHGRRAPRELEFFAAGEEEEEEGRGPPPRRPPEGAVVGDFPLAQLRSMRWRRVRNAPPELGRLRSGASAPRRRAKPPEEGPLLVSQALDVVLGAWRGRDAEGGGQGPTAGGEQTANRRRTLILDVKRPEGAAAANVTFESVAQEAARAVAESGCGSTCVLWAADDEASRALAEAVKRHGGSGGGKGAAGRPPRIGYVVAFAEGEEEPALVPRLEGVAQVAAVDVAVLSLGRQTRRRGGGGGDGGGGGGAFAAAGQTLVAFVVDGARALRAAAQGGGSHAVVTDAPIAVSNVLSAWRRRCGRG
jgi:hypothetical protein